MKARLNNILALITLLVSSVTVPAKAQESQLEPSYDSRKEKYGYRIKGTRNEVIPPRYSRVEEFYKGKAVVMNDDFLCVIDEKGAVFPDEKQQNTSTGKMRDTDLKILKQPIQV
ncbi:MAG: WG repeat-containing protein [Bacteroidales bacterium]